MRVLLLIGLSIFGLVAISYAQAPLPSDSLSRLAQDYRFYDEPVDPEFYLIRPGESLVVTFFDGKLSSLELTVGPEGQIIHRTLGVVDVSGRTLAQAREVLRASLKGLFAVEDFRITVTEPRRVAVTVSGAVEEPGLYMAFTSQRVSEMIELAGGVRYNGSTRHILFTGGVRPLPVDLDRVLYLGDNSADPCLYAGHTIFVPDRSADRIQVVGEVNHPRDIEFNPADDINTLIAFAGGARSAANLDSILVYGDNRRGPAGEDSLQPGDILFIPARQQAPADRKVIVFGAVSEPGRYDYRDSMTVADLLSRAGGATDDASLSLTTVFRRAGADAWGRRSTIRFPITASSGNESQLKGMVLSPADSVYIPFYVGYVRVSGEVANPGLFGFRSGQNALFYIEAAGGYLPTANTEQIEMYNRVAKVTTRISPGVTVGEGYELVVSRREELN